MVVAKRLEEAGCQRALPTQIVAAALVLAFPIHQGFVVVVVAVLSVPVFLDPAIGQVFPVSVAEEVLLSSERPSHHPSLQFRILSRLEENCFDSPTAAALVELARPIYPHCCRGLVHPISWHSSPQTSLALPIHLVHLWELALVLLAAPRTSVAVRNVQTPMETVALVVALVLAPPVVLQSLRVYLLLVAPDGPM